MFFVTLVVFLVIFSLLILVHEWGHFYVARKTGIKVEEFGIGLPPRAKGLFKDKKGTLYSLNWIPFGGFVRLYGEDSSDEKVLKSKESYASKTVLQRSAVVLAGVVMNFLLAWLLISVGFTFGMKPFLATQQDFDRAQQEGLLDVTPALYVHELTEDSALLAAGVEEGDLILEVDGQPAPSSEDFSSRIVPNQSVSLLIMDSVTEDTQTVSAQANADGKLGIVISTAPIVSELRDIQYPFYSAPIYAVREVGRLSVLTVVMLGDVVQNLVQKFAVPEGVAGPVGIFKMTERVTQQGIMDLLQFTALLSISLGVLNVMPFPALDGGRFFFILVEVMTRRKMNPKWEGVTHAIGFILLLGLIFIITWNDIFG